jgi:uncharacterized protein
MRRFRGASLGAAALCFAVALAGPALAAGAEPTEHQIYEAATTGRLDEAQQMMDQVLRNHPTSAKAHFDQSELYAREGKYDLARSELNQAEQLKPGLPDESPRAVAELKAQLTSGRTSTPFAARPAVSTPHFPWGTVLILMLVVGVFWAMFRRRSSYGQYPAGAMPTAGAPGPYGPGPYGPQGYGGPMGGGVGSSIAGGLAGGLAAGAGIVAGEELAHHFLDGGQRQSEVLPSAPPPNGDMGGADFGDANPGSWDDNSGGGGDFGGGGGGGGGDWS